MLKNCNANINYTHKIHILIHTYTHKNIPTHTVIYKKLPSEERNIFIGRICKLMKYFKVFPNDQSQ